MKIGVVGTFIRDRIFPWQGEEVESIGGIFFTVSYLANLLGEEDEIYPVCYVGEDFYEKLVGELSTYPNVRLEGLHVLPRKNTQVKLIYTGPQEREEVTTEPMPPLGYEELYILNDVDAVEINLITGLDVDLATLKKFSQTTRALLYLDFHSHALGINGTGKRYYRRPDDWLDWINLAHILQLNEMEARTLGGLPKETPKDELIEFGKEVLQYKPYVCHITLAEEGSLLFYENEGQVKIKKIEALKINPVIDIIGCGDAFAAGFLVQYLQNGDIEAATHFANRIAGINCTFVGSTKIRQIKSLLNSDKLQT